MPESSSSTIPAPTGGWNARDPLNGMSPDSAVRLVNIFPQPGYVELRNGFRVHSKNLGTTPVRTLVELSTGPGVRKLIGASGSSFYDCSTYNVNATLLGTGFTSDKWQSVNFKDRRFFVNGVDTAQVYDGTTLANCTFTGVTLSTLTNISVYHNRLYFVDTTSFWYGAVNGVSGALTQFDCSGLFQKGGFIQYAGAWTRDSGAASLDLFCIFSNMGEVVLYSGDYPGGTSWTFAGRFFIPSPLGKRGQFNHGADLITITQNGTLPLSSVLRNTSSDDFYDKISDKIRDAFRTSATNYGTSFGWEGIVYPKSHMLLVNVPTVVDSMSEQYVMNTLTGAWCKFTGWNASTFSLFKDNLFFGGMDGKVYQADIGGSDNGNFINVDCKLAFNNLGEDQHIKHFTFARPLITGGQNIAFSFDVDVDFYEVSPTSTVSTQGAQGSPWDSSPWNTSSWDNPQAVVENWYSTTGLGRSVAIKFQGSFLNSPFNISAFHILYELGGML